MKLQRTDLLFLIFVLIFSLGTYIVVQNGTWSFYFGLYYFLCLYILRRSITPDFYLSADKNRFDVSESKMLVLGEALPSVSREDLQEERFLNHFHLPAVAKRQFFTYFALGTSILLLFYRAKIPVGLHSVVPIICGLLFIKSIFVGHLFLPLALNIFLVIFHYDKNDDLSFSFYAVYLLLIFSALKTISELSGPQLKWKKTFALLPLALLFGASVYGLNFFFQSKPTPEEISRELAPTRRLLRGMDSRTNSLLSQMASFPKNRSSLELGQKLAQQLQDISDLEKMMAKDGATPENRRHLEKVLATNKEISREMSALKSGALERQEGGLTPGLEDLAKRHGTSQAADIEAIKDAIEKNQEELFTMQKESSQGTLSQERINELERKREELKSSFEKMSQLSSSEREDLKRFVEQKTNELKTIESLEKKEFPELRKSLKGIEEVAGASNPTPAELRQLSEHLNEAKSIEKLKSGAIKERIPELNTVDAHRALDPFQKKSARSWKKFLPLAVFILLILIATHFVKKKGIKEVEIRDEDLLKELKTRWRELKRLNLSPREEVIHYYNVLHDIFQKVHYPSHETPPSCIVFEDMQDFNPKLERATYVVTEVYTHCFYGNKEVTVESLKNFRKAIHQMMKVYRIQ